MSRSRTRVLLGLVALVTGAAAGAWVASAGIESPADAAARTAPPSPSPILVPLEQRVLTSNVVTRGTAGFGVPLAVAVASSPLKGNAAGVITTLPARNAQFKEGDVLFTASGRPVFVLQGDVPAYRDLGPGAYAKDVEQLEQALKRLGFDPGPVDGSFDGRTGSAVARWYTAAGYDEFGPTPEQATNLRTLEVAREDAVRAKISAVSAAAGADLALEAAKRKAHHAEKSAAAELEAAVAERSATALKPGQAMTRAGADARLEAARAAVRAASAENEANIHAAVEAKKIAHFDVTVAASRFDRAAAELDRALSKVGVQVPLDEIVFIPKLPVRVQEVSAAVGSAASGPVVSVTDNHLIVRSALPLQAAPLVKPGMEVQIDEPAYGVKLKGLVEHVEQTPGTHGLDGYHVYLAVAVEDTALRLEGFSLRLTIPVVSTKGTVLAAPISAVSLGADGASRVTLEEDGRFATVIVEPGLAANGYVELSTRDEALRPGRLVVVGHMSPDQTNKVEERQAPRFDLSGLIRKVKNAYDALYQFALAALDSEAPSSTEAVRTQ